MNKREKHRIDLKQFQIAGNDLADYLLHNSNLPGKRGNIELAFSFADYVEDIYTHNRDIAFTYCGSLIDQNPPKAKIVGNEEFLPFCGIVALGRIGKIDITRENDVFHRLKSAATDERWRIREAVAMAIQELMDVRPVETIETLRSWIQDTDYLVHRAVVAGLAEPRFMKDSGIANSALEIHKSVLKNVAREPSMRDKDFQVLVKGLCYTLSVIITGIADDGFALLAELSEIDHPIIRKIVRENLKKNRLKRLNEKKVSELQGKIQ